jgi:hypothetical protein
MAGLGVGRLARIGLLQQALGFYGIRGKRVHDTSLTY